MAIFVARSTLGNWILKDPNRSKCAGNINDAIIWNQTMVEKFLHRQSSRGGTEILVLFAQNFTKVKF